MMITVKGGPIGGHTLRRARKERSCDGLPEGRSGRRCPNKIMAGDYYALGPLSAFSAGKGMDRLCLECAGPEARASVSASQGRAAA